MPKTKKTAAQHAFRYKKSLGQHFLYQEDVLEALVDAAGVTPEDGVLEIGPGSGALTAPLARRARRVVAVEVDDTLLPVLHASLAPYGNVEIVHGDIMQADLSQLASGLGTPCRLVANLPYYLTTPLLLRLLEARLPFCVMAVMVQREVCARMLAAPGEEAYCPLSVWTQLFAQPSEAMRLPAAWFTPPPKVDSSFVLLRMRTALPVPETELAMFLRVVRAAFAMRRKTLLNNLQSALALPREQAIALLQACSLVPTVRGEQVSIAGFAALASVLCKMQRG